MQEKPTRRSRLYHDYSNPEPEPEPVEPRPRPSPFAWLVRALVVVVAIGVLWAMVAGLEGYTLGNPPTGLAAVGGPSCYHITRVDFVVPMWKPVDPIQCGQTGP